MFTEAKLIAYAVGAIMLLGAGGYVAWEIQAKRIDDMKVANLQNINDAWKAGWAKRDHQDEITLASNAANGTDQGHINGNTQEIIRYVTKYITPTDDAACHLPPGFSRLLDAALLGVAPDQLPADTAEPVGPAAALTLSRAVPVLAQSLGDYAATRARILNARDDWNKQAAPPAPKPSWWERNF